MRKLIKFSLLLALFAVVFTSCKDGDTIYDPVGDLPTVVIEKTPGQTPNEVTATFKPGPGTATMKFAIGSPQDREAFLNGTFEGIEISKGAGEVTRTYSELEDGRLYIIYAIAYDELERSGGMSSEYFNVGIEGDFSVGVQFVSDTGAAFHMLTDANVVYSYRYHLGPESDRAEFLAGRIGTSRVEAGNHTAYYFDLTPSTSYVFFTETVGRYGENEFYETPVKTLTAGEAPAVTFTPGGDAYFVDMTFTGNDLTGDILIIASRMDSGLEVIINNDYNIYKGDIIYAIEDWYAIKNPEPGHIDFSETGSLATTFENLYYLTGTEYLVFAISYDKDGKAANVQRIEYTVPLVGSAPAATVTAVVLENSLEKIKYSITPDANTYAYAFQVHDAASIDESVPGHEAQLIYDYFLSWSGDYRYCGSNRSTITIEDTEDIEPDTRYYLLVVPFNINGEDGVGQLAIQEFTTPAAQ